MNFGDQFDGSRGGNSGRHGYARHIGRVGGLAVALGVFGAVATSPGVAWAETGTPSDAGPSGTSAPSASGSTDTSTGSGTGADQSTDQADTDTEGSDTGATDDTDAAPDDPDDPDADADPEAADPDGEDAGTDSQDTEQTPDGDESGTEVDDDPSVGGEPSTGTPAQLPPATSESESGGAAEASESSEESSSVQHVSAARVNDTQADTHADSALQSAAAALSVTPAAAATANNPLVMWGKQIGSALHLPTPTQVVEQIKSATVYCLCGTINTITKLLGGVMSPAATPGPASPAQEGVLWTVLAWARRQVDYAVAAFNSSSLGRWVHELGVAATDWVTDLGNTPDGRKFSAAVAAFLAQCNDSTELSDDFDRTVVVPGLNEPTDFEFIMDDGDPDEIHHILFTEKSGALKSYDTHTGLVTTLATFAVTTGNGERGLIGIEVDPNFWGADGEPGSHMIYLAYTGADNFDRLSSFRLTDAAGSPAGSLNSLGTETVLVKSTLSANEFHHAGELEFDPTGQYLYWAVGNNTVSANSQDLTNIHGKILRLNRDGTAVAGNPFISSTNEITKLIYAYGFRNPFRFAVDPQSGAVLAGDVGEATWEELNLVQPGGNYGWPNAEGSAPGSGYVDPLYSYAHDNATKTGSITAVLVLDDDSVPGQKKVMIADYSLGWIKELTFDDQYTSLISEKTFDSGAGTVVKLAQAPNGDIYQLNIYPGTLSVITPSGGNRAPTADIDASATSGVGNSLEVDFSGSGSSDPDGDPLTYQWNFGNGQTGTGANPATVTFTNTGAGYTSYTVTLTVTDDGGKQNTTTQQIVVGSTPPQADFATVSGSYKYNAGDTVSFTATASDLQDSAGLPENAYSWTVEFRHALHKHPFIDNATGSQLSFTIPTDYDQLANTWYRVILTVTDSSGLKTTVTKDVTPNTVSLTFGASDDAQYTLDGIPRTGTYTEDAVVGVHRTLGVVLPQNVNGVPVTFGNWSDGGAATHVIVTPGASTSYIVTYEPVSSSIAV